MQHQLNDLKAILKEGLTQMTHQIGLLTNRKRKREDKV